MKRTIRLACLLMSLLLALPACGEGASNPVEATQPAVTEETTPAETTKADPLAHLKEENYGGYTFRMLIRNAPDWINDMIAEELTGEVVNDAVHRRNTEICSRYNIEITHTPSSHPNSETDAKPLILAGSDDYDLLVPHPRASHIYANEGLVEDWNKLKYVDLDQPWWDQDAKESFQMPGGLFCMIGDLSYQSVGSCNAMLFNKEYFDQNKLEYPYQMVKDGKWTIDVFRQLAEDYSRDVDGDGVYSEKDVYGYATFQWIGPIQAFYSSGARVIEKESDTYAFSVYNNRSVSMFEKYFALLNSAYSTMDATSSTSFDAQSTKLFREGRCLFTDVNITLVLKLREMEDDFGILPWPKLEESDEKYWSNVDAGTNLFVIPITNPDLDRTSMILESMSILGREYVIPSYYEVALKTRDSRDEESAAMLDIIVQNRVFDLGYYNEGMGGAYASHFRDLAKDKIGDFASWYDGKLKAAEQKRDDTLSLYTKRLEG